jgi:aspartyl-tRNA(Asn)/glutamyl-tRNA(Gln) amidotransferase subunit B
MPIPAHPTYQLVIGLEVHAQLLTESKIFSSDSTHFGSEPNTQVSVITLAHPGILPKLNKKTVEYAIKMGLACHCEISRYNIFDRKNYFYPDLPKGYQLTQDRTPICKGGFVSITLKDNSKIDVKLNRIHLEEDAGKSIHLENETDTLLDFNRAGVPLIEIVTEPVMHTAEQAGAVLSEIRKLVRYLDVCDGNMEEGSLRCDANVSVMLHGAKELGKKVEVKNMNSVRNVQHAIEHEFERQVNLLERGEAVISETRTFDVTSGKTYSMRTKEELNDYRYFPDPDLSPLIISDEWLSQIKSSMPELPEELLLKYTAKYGLPEYDARVLTETKEMAAYFEEVCHSYSTLQGFRTLEEFVSGKGNFKAVSNWTMGAVKSYLNEHNILSDKFPIRASALAELIYLVESGKISNTMATQKLFPKMLGNHEESPLSLAQRLNLFQESDSNAIEKIIEEVLIENATKVDEYKKGKKGLISMFMGEVMKRSKGKADPKIANEILLNRLKN